MISLHGAPILRALKTTGFILILATTLFSCLREKNEAPAQSSGGRSGDIPRRWSAAALSSPLRVGTSDAIRTYFDPGDEDGEGHEPDIQMMKRWNEVIGGLQFFAIPSPNTNPEIANREYPLHENYLEDGEFGIYLHNTWFDSIPNSVLAITVYSGYRRQAGTQEEWIEIVHADIVANNQHTFSNDPNDGNTYHLPSVLLHELGHLIGLVHQLDGRPAVMAPSLSASESYSTPYLADNQALQSIYASTTALFAPDSKGARPLSPKSSTGLSGPGIPVRGWIELHSDGTCRHYQDQQLVREHSLTPLDSH